VIGASEARMTVLAPSSTHVCTWHKQTYSRPRKTPLLTDAVEKVLLNTGES